MVSREEALTRIRAAVDERDSGSMISAISARGGAAGGGGGSSISSSVDNRIVLVARSDARQAESLSEALWRVAAFADAGADVVFIDALESVDEMRQLVRAVPSHVAKLANMLEGGGKTPILTPQQIEDLGFELAVYPLSLIGASVRGMQVREALGGVEWQRRTQLYGECCARGMIAGHVHDDDVTVCWRDGLFLASRQVHAMRHNS